MNRNVMVGALVVISITLFVFVGKLREGSSSGNVSQVADKNITSVASTGTGGSPAIQDESKKVVKNLSEDEMLSKLKGYWAIPIDIRISNQDYQYQFYFKEVLNPDLKNGHKVQGILFSNLKENNAIQTIATLEPVMIDQDKYVFDIKNLDISKFYSDGSYSDEGTYKRLVVNLKNNDLFFNLTSDNEIDKSINLKANKIDLKRLNDFKFKLSSVKLDDKAKVVIDLTAINDFENDFGIINYKSNECSGESRFKIRPISDKLILATAGFGSSCVESITLKIAKGNNDTFQALVYSRSQVPYELSFSK